MRFSRLLFTMYNNQDHFPSIRFRLTPVRFIRFICLIGARRAGERLISMETVIISTLHRGRDHYFCFILIVELGRGISSLIGFCNTVFFRPN